MDFIFIKKFEDTGQCPVDIVRLLDYSPNQHKFWNNSFLAKNHVTEMTIGCKQTSLTLVKSTLAPGGKHEPKKRCKITKKEKWRK